MGDAPVDVVRHWMAVLLVIGYPPGVLYWYAVHPFAERWRRLGPAVSLAILLPALVGAVLAGLAVRASLIGADLGFTWATVLPGLLLYGLGLGVERRCRRQLRLRVLAGVPELSQARPGRLLTEGIYGRVRHPRYVAVLLTTTGWALVANHTGAYVLSLAASLALFGVVGLEERELADRFGHAWTEYARRVPRFVPRPGH
ncbi:MAG: isoprenylcysteine carboxylmethyltransferase family protein [Gemmatimonadota bacterium]